MERCCQELQSWDKIFFHELRKEIEQSKKELDRLQCFPYSEENSQQVRTTKNKVVALLRKEEMFWLQWSRSSWIVEGDMNTTFSLRWQVGERGGIIFL